MLVITRKPGEIVLIGDNIEVRIIEVHGKMVKIGVSAPAHLCILRGELTSQKQSRSPLGRPTAKKLPAWLSQPEKGPPMTVKDLADSLDVDADNLIPIK